MRRFAFALAVVSLVTAANRCLAETTQTDQLIAQAIVETLREHQNAGRLKGFDIDLNVENGRVVLSGDVVDEKQHNIAIDAARFAPGVKVVVNDLKIKGTTHEHPEQQKKLSGPLATMFQSQGVTPAADTAGLLTGLRKAWGQPAAQAGAAEQPSVKPIADAAPPTGAVAEAAAAAQPAISQQTTGKKIDALSNPDPLTQDKHIASGYSAFTANAPRTPVATINEVNGATALAQAEPVAEPAEQFVATPASQQAQSQLSRWEPREIAATPDAQPQVAQAYASGTTPAAQTASAIAQPQIAQAAQQQIAQPVQQQVQPAQQIQAVQMIPIPVPVYPQQYQQYQQRMPVAYAASRLPGGQMPQGHVRMAQAMQPQQMAPAPQFIQGTGGGMAPARYDHPNMPGYAWPSYASSPNYAALQYPKQYSAHAWPYIGPFYPYPQVPLGWRKVTLSWDDGWWNLDFKDRGYGPYVTR